MLVGTNLTVSLLILMSREDGIKFVDANQEYEILINTEESWLTNYQNYHTHTTH